MNKPITKFSFVILLIIEAITVKAQPIASFTIDRYNICSGTSLNLVNTSINATRFDWLIDGAQYSWATDTTVTFVEICYDMKEIMLIATDTITMAADSQSLVVEVFDTCFFHWTGDFLNCPGDTIRMQASPEEIETRFTFDSPYTLVSGCDTCPSIEFILITAGTLVDRKSTYLGGCFEITSFHYLCNPVSISGIDEPSIKIFPNPAGDYLQIDGLITDSELHLLDLSGRILRNKIISTHNDHLDISDLKDGLYILKIQDCLGNAQLRKFIKK